MVLKTYTPDLEKVIVHQTGVDFNARPSIFQPIHVVQYDSTMPIIAVAMYNNGQEYAAPSNAGANIRFRKKGGTVVYNQALGCSTDRKIIYFEVTHQMATDYGDFRPIIEIVVGSTIAGSSAINVIIDKNPIQEGDVESSDECTALKDYVNDAKTYADNAKNSQNAAKSSEDSARSSASSAAASESKAASSAASANASKEAAATSASEASNSAEDAAASKDAALASQNAAKTSENNSKDWSDWSKSYAIGEGEKRDDEASDNAKYYYDQAKRISQGLAGALLPMGTIVYANLKNSTKSAGYMYNISDAFISDITFEDGGGKYYGPGANVYWTAGGKWDVLAAVTVTGVKGNAETGYSQGNVEIGPEDIKLSSTFAVATARANVSPNDALDVAFSKLAKYCSDLNYVAFTGEYSDLSGQPNSLKNPNPITFTGASNVVYDGSKGESVSVQSPTGDTKDNVTTYTSGDNLNPTGWSNVELITSGEKHISLFAKLSTMAKNARYLWKMLGSSDISKIGDGTVTSALVALMADKLNKRDIVNDLLSTAEDKALSAAMGKQLQDAVSKLNTEISDRALYTSHNIVSSYKVPHKGRYLLYFAAIGAEFGSYANIIVDGVAVASSVAIDGGASLRSQCVVDLNEGATVQTNPVHLAERTDTFVIFQVVEL